MRTTLVADALETAVATRGGHVDGVVFHSDRGCQYTSAEFGELCDRLGVVQSMGATGVCWDNAAAESFFGTLKRELALQVKAMRRSASFRLGHAIVLGVKSPARILRLPGAPSPSRLRQIQMTRSVG